VTAGTPPKVPLTPTLSHDGRGSMLGAVTNCPIYTLMPVLSQRARGCRKSQFVTARPK